MKIGIFGGTFNPPHLGHLAAARTAVAVLGLDKLLIIPAANPPHKELPEGIRDQVEVNCDLEQLAAALYATGGLPLESLLGG